MGGPLLVNHQPAWRVAGVLPCEAGSADRAERKAEPDLLPHPKRVNPWHPGISAPFAANTDLECRCRRSRGFRLVQPVHGSPAARPGRVDECAAVIRCAGVWQGGWVPRCPVQWSKASSAVSSNGTARSVPSFPSGTFSRPPASSTAAGCQRERRHRSSAPSTSNQNACRSLSVSSTASHAYSAGSGAAGPHSARLDRGTRSVRDDSVDG